MDVINESEKDYYDKLYKISVWTGIGYSTKQYYVYANHEEQALEILVAWAEDHDDMILFSSDTVYNDYLECGCEEDGIEFDDYVYENWYYVDATMEGASDVWYIQLPFLNIEKIKEEN